MTSLFLDNREPLSIQRTGKKFFPNLKVTTLPVGDVVAGNILVERKEVADFAQSITDKSKRYVNQSVNMVEAANRGAHVYEIIQGSFKEYETSGYCSISRKAFRGAIASLTERHKIQVLMVDDEVDFWLQIDRLIEKYFDDRPIQHVDVIPNGSTVQERMIKCVDGIDQVRGKALAERFTISELCKVTQKELLEVGGIGPKRARSIINGFQHGGVSY